MLNYNVTGIDRKNLVMKIAELTGERPVYLGMPSAAFKIGAYTVSRTGELAWEENADADRLIEELRNAGFVGMAEEENHAPEEEQKAAEKTAESPETPQESALEDGSENTSETREKAVESAQEASESTQDSEAEEAETSEPATLSITLPDDLTEEQFNHLQQLVSGKATLIKHAFKTDSVEITRADQKLTFPWFRAIDGMHTHAYTAFLIALIQKARDAKRVRTRDNPVENEKFAFRIFLISIGLIGDEYKADRKVLLENLSGNSAWKDGRPEK